MPSKNGTYTNSVAIDRAMYEAVSKLAEEAGTSKGNVATAILRLGIAYYRNRWADFVKQYPELSPNGTPIQYTQNRPTVPLR